MVGALARRVSQKDMQDGDEFVTAGSSTHMTSGREPGAALREKGENMTLAATALSTSVDGSSRAPTTPPSSLWVTHLTYRVVRKRLQTGRSAW